MKQLVAIPLFFICTFAANAQSYPGIGIAWTGNVGCSAYDSEGHILIEELKELPCLQVCEGGEVHFWITGLPVPEEAVINWTPIGGDITGSWGNYITTEWNNLSSTSALYGEIDIGDGTLIDFTLCLELQAGPTAGFTLPPPGEEPVFCVNQEIYFTNTSFPNPGGQLVDFHWQFGSLDSPTGGETSNEFEPVYSFDQPGGYTVSLTVWNECGCSDTFEMDIIIEDMGEPVEISCPTVTCENSIEMYSAEVGDCDAFYHWEVEGGTILNGTEHNPIVEIQWDDVDETGFGWITLHVDGCEMCPVPSKVKVPVVQESGQIQPWLHEDIEPLCKGTQYRFYMPQWPSTEFEWELEYEGSGAMYNGFLDTTDQRNEILVSPEGTMPTGIYSLRVVYYNTLKKCSGIAQRRLIIYDTPHQIIGPDKACEGDELTYQTVEPDAQTFWVLRDQDNTVVQTHTGVTFTTGLSPGTYVLTANAPERCTGEGFVIHIYDYAPTPAGAFDLPEEVCAGVAYEVSFSNTDPNINPNHYYLEWDVDNGKVSGPNTGAQTLVTFDQNPSGDYKVLVRYVRKSNPQCASGWIESDPIAPVEVNTTIEAYDPDTELVITHNEFCTSTETHFRVDELDGDEYQWSLFPSNFGTVSQGQDSPEVTIMWNEISNGVSTGEVRLQIRRCGDWFTVAHFEAEKINAPDITLDFPSQVCAFEAFDVTVNSSVPLNGWEDFTLDLNQGEVVLTNPIQINPTEFVFSNVSTTSNVQGNVSYNISVEITRPNGCFNSSTASETILVIPTPVVNIVPNIPSIGFCDASALAASGLEFEAIEQNGIVQVNSWKWHLNGNPIPGATAATYSPTAFGDYTVEVIAANGCIAVSNIYKIIEIDCSGGGGDPGNPSDPCPNEGITVNANWTACHTIMATASFTNNAPNSIQWTTSPSYGITLVNTTANTAEFEVDSPGNYTISGIGSWNCGYKADFDTASVRYQPLLHYSVACTPTGDYEVTLFNDSPFVSGTPPDETVFYVNGTPHTYTGNQDDHTAIVPPGIHEFQLQVSRTGMPACTTPVLELDLTPPDAAFTLPAAVCANDHGYGELIWLIPDNPNPDHRYLWEFDETGNLNMETPITLNHNSQFVITLTVTDRYGCSTTSTQNIGINLADYSEYQITGHQDPVCEGETVELSLENPSTGNPPSGITYQWLYEDDPISGATNPTYAAGQNGFYGLEVTDTDGCIDRIDPVPVTIIPEPWVTITGPETACLDQPFTLRGRSANTGYARRWLRDGVQLHPLSPTTPWTITESFATPGIYTYTLQVGDPALGECTNEEDFIIEVVPAPDPVHVEISFQVTCNPFEVVATLVNPDPNGIYNWSTGEKATEIIVRNSGLLAVTYTNEWGCSITKKKDIPHLPEEHLWVFPTGCVEICPRVESSPTAYVIGPLPQYDSHAWLWNGFGNPQFNMQVPPEYLQTDGRLQLELGTDVVGTFCNITSGVLDVSYAEEGCRKCETEEVSIDIEHIEQGTNFQYLYYTIIANFTNNHGVPLTFQLNSDDGIYVPGSVTIPPGTTQTVSLIFIPDAGFTGGFSDVFVQLLYNGQFFCNFEFTIDYPMPMPKFNSTMLFSVAPNPATHTATVYYDLSGQNSGHLTVYSLTGVALIEQTINREKGEATLPLHTLSSGTYIVVLRDAAGTQLQQVLLKK